MLEAYKKLYVEQRHKLSQADKGQALLSGYEVNEQRVYEQLFIDFGEDIKDIKRAWDHYHLDVKITSDDEERYAVNN